MVIRDDGRRLVNRLSPRHRLQLAIMVSIRRPTPRTNKPSIFSVQNVILGLVALLFTILSFRGGPGESKDHRLRKPAGIEIERVPEEKAKQNHAHHTDADDHISKSEPKVAKVVRDAGKRKEHVAAKKPDEVKIKVKETNKKQNVVDKRKVVEKTAEKPQRAEVKAEHGQGDGKDPNAIVLAKHGTGPTKLGYVVDLVQERAHPAFRNAEFPTQYTELETKVAALLKDVTSLKACEYLSGRKLLQRERCRDKETRLIAYNGASFPRFLCGHLLEPGQALELETPCNEPAHLFEHDDPPVSGKGMPPIVVHNQSGSTIIPEDSLGAITCDIPCQFQKDMTGADRFIAGTEWKLVWTDADPYFNEKAKIERLAYRNDQYYVTTSLSSSVPISFYSFDKYNLRNRPALEWDKAANKATYLLDDNCNLVGGIRRQKWYAAVESSFHTESYGSCSHNTDLVEGETIGTLEGRVALSKKNRMHLAFDAGNDKDYVTPIVWEAYLSGAVPVILGARNAEEFLPRHSAIYAAGYNDWDKFAAYVKKVSENKELWESFHSWRSDETALSAFETRFNFTKVSSECRTCRWAYAKKYGLGWDHERQVVREAPFGSKLCVDQGSQLISKPFREIWVGSKPVSPLGKDVCKTMSITTSVEQDSYKVERSVMRHDGLVDMAVLSFVPTSDADAILTLEFDVNNAEGAFFPNTHTLVPALRTPLISSASLQDEKVKVTVLASWETEIKCSGPGIVEIVLRGSDKMHSDEGRRIRVIMEYRNVLHDKLTEFYPSSYGKKMVKDFVDPVEYFYHDS